MNTYLDMAVLFFLDLTNFVILGAFYYGMLWHILKFCIVCVYVHMGARVYVFMWRYVQVYVEVRGQPQVPSSHDALGLR